MRKDFELIKHKFEANEDIVVYPISDVHYGAIEHDNKAWEKLCAEILAQPNAYIILNGDLLNNCTRSSISNVFDEVAPPRAQKKYMVECLTPLRDRILCIVTGNHERRSIKDADDDPTYDIAAKLDIEDRYRRDIAFVSIGIGKRTDVANGSMVTHQLVVTHGAGGGIYTGAAVNRNERFGNIIEGLDCLIVGHTHKGTVSKPSKLVIDPRNGIVVQREYVVVSCVSWMEYGGYAAQKMLLPSAHSCPQKLILRKGNDRHTSRIEVVW